MIYKTMKTAGLLIFLMIAQTSFSQETVHLYNPEANAARDLEQALLQAGQQNKNVLVQVGGNWCGWCIKLHNFIESHEKIDSVLQAGYILIRINYSPENKNQELLSKLDYPQRFGFPVLLVLDQSGRRLHTQDTYLLEKDKSYDEEKLIRFLQSWNVLALDPESYQPDAK